MKKTKNQSNSALSEQIEQQVRDRNSVEVLKLIPVFLKLHQRNSLNLIQAKIKAAEWLRRLGKFRQAYFLVAPKSWNFRKVKVDPAIASQFLWSAFYLNLMGANPYALQILKELTFTKTDELRVAGNIFISVYEYARAKEALEKADRLDPDPLSYSARIHRIGISDALVGLGKPEEALRVLDKIKATDDERLMQGILHQARGEYFAHQKKYELALESFRKAVPFFTENDTSLDYGFLLKWCAFVNGKLGKTNDAKTQFELANRILKAPDRRAEVWIDSLLKMDELGLLDQESRVFLHLYPGLNRLSRGLSLFSPKAKMIIFKDRDEWRDEKGKFHLGLSLELQALTLMVQSGTYGISLERLKPLLWPEDLASFAQLDNRLFQLFKRIKTKLKMDVLVVEGNAYIAAKHLLEISLEQLGFSGKPTLYETHSEFSSADFMKYYDLKKTRASVKLSEQVTLGKIKRITRGKTTVYQVCN